MFPYVQILVCKGGQTPMMFADLGQTWSHFFQFALFFLSSFPFIGFENSTGVLVNKTKYQQVMKSDEEDNLLTLTTVFSFLTSLNSHELTLTFPQQKVYYYSISN